MESPEFKAAMRAKSLAGAEVDSVTNKDDPLTSFTFAVKSMAQKSKLSN